MRGGGDAESRIPERRTSDGDAQLGMAEWGASDGNAPLGGDVRYHRETSAYKSEKEELSGRSTEFIFLDDSSAPEAPLYTLLSSHSDICPFFFEMLILRRQNKRSVVSHLLILHTGGLKAKGRNQDDQAGRMGENLTGDMAIRRNSY